MTITIEIETWQALVLIVALASPAGITSEHLTHNQGVDNSEHINMGRRERKLKRKRRRSIRLRAPSTKRHSAQMKYL